MSPSIPKFAIPDQIQFSDKEKSIVKKVLQMIRLKIPLNKESPTGKKVIIFYYLTYKFIFDVLLYFRLIVMIAH